MNVKDQVNELIAESLSEARSVVEKGGAWEPLVHFVHSVGVQSMRVPGLHAGPFAKAEQVGEINLELSRPNGEFLITVSAFGLVRTLQKALWPSPGIFPFPAAASGSRGMLRSLAGSRSTRAPRMGR